MEIKRTLCCCVNPQRIHFLNVPCNPDLPISERLVQNREENRSQAGEMMMKGMTWNLCEKQVNRPRISHLEERWELSVISSKKYPATVRWQAQNKQKIKATSTERVNCLCGIHHQLFSALENKTLKGSLVRFVEEERWADLHPGEMRPENRQQTHSQLSGMMEGKRPSVTPDSTGWNWSATHEMEKVVREQALSEKTEQRKMWLKSLHSVLSHAVPWLNKISSFHWVGCLRVSYLLSSSDTFWCCGHTGLKEKVQTDPTEISVWLGSPSHTSPESFNIKLLTSSTRHPQRMAQPTNEPRLKHLCYS